MKPSIARSLRTAALAAAFAAGAIALVTAQGRGAPPAAPAPQVPAQPNQPARDLQRTPAVGTGVISGTVVTEGSGTPVRRARVTLSGAELRGGRTAVTNDEGSFSFTSLPAGRFTMTASKNGYVDIAYGAKRPGRPGTPIQLVDGQKLEKANLSLPRGSVVTGVVIDENGEPSPGTQVRVLRYVMRTGEKILQQQGQDQTDDRGMYRIYGLQPGEYIVSAAPRNLNFGDLRQTMMAEIEALMQQAQALGAGAGRGGAGGGAGGPGRGGRGGGGLGTVMIEPGIAGQAGGRGQALLDRATALQQQLQQQEQEQPVAYAPVYYPGTTTPSAASSVTLAIGDERSGVDFQLQLVPTASVQGTVVGPDGSPVQETRISLVPADNSNMPPIPGVSSNLARVDREGRFTFSNVTPGQYRIMARAAVRQNDPNAPTAPQRGGGRGDFGGPGGRGGPQVPQQIFWTSADISVSGQNVSNIALTLQPGMSVSGRVNFEGSGGAVAPTDLTRVRVNLVPRGQQQGGFEIGGVPPAQVDSTGRFTFTGVVPGRYSINATAPSGDGGRGAGAAPAAAPSAQWVMKSAVAGGRDVLDFGLVIEPNQEVSGTVLTFTDRTQEVSGTIQDTTGQPTADYSIVIYPSDSRYWVPQARRIQSVRPGTDGQFTFRGLPPGEYRLTAVTDAEPGEWFNSDFLSQLVNASISVTLIDGEKKTQNIRVR